MRTNVILVTLVAVATLLVAGDLRAADQVSKGFASPATFAGTIQTANCSAAPGPQVTVQGSLTLPGLRTEVIFTDPTAAPNHQAQVHMGQDVIPVSQALVIPQQSVTGAVGDNPYIWLQLTDQRGRPLTSEIFLGRCDQAQFNATADLQVPVTALAGVSTSACGSSPIVNLDGQVQIEPVNGTLIFRNTNEMTGPRKAFDEGAVGVALLPTGQAYPFPQPEVTGGTIVNPLISIQFRQGNGEPLDSEIRLGRCVALMN